MEALQLMARFGIHARGIVHVGANRGQEFEAYKASGASTVVYIEPLSSVFAELEQRVSSTPGHHAIRAVCSNRSGERVRFNIASNRGESSSMLELGHHAKLYPNIRYEGFEELVTETLDDLCGRLFPDASFNFLAVDTQGADLMVLQGADQVLKNIEAVYIEVAEVPLYEGGCTWPEIVAHLGERGFSLKMLDINVKRWGNAFFVRNERTANDDARARNLALGKPAKQSSHYNASKRNRAGNAVDGVRTGSYGFHTALERNPWWQVDLEGEHALTEVVVYNRTDTASERAYSFRLELSSDGENWRVAHRQAGKPFGGVVGGPARIALDGQRARFVRIALDDENYLHLDEVEVYSDPI